MPNEVWLLCRGASYIVNSVDKYPLKKASLASAFGLHRLYRIASYLWRCVIMSNLLRCFGATENRLHLGQTQTVPVWFGSRFALFFESRTQSRTAVQAERRIKGSLNYAEAKPALAAKQQQYAPSFSLSAPCILLTLTRRLRVISNAYFDTPSLPKEPKCLLRPYPYSPLQWDLFFNAFSINGSF